ncbi:hypothetical protein D3C81_1490780 [compost metagenome]
MLHAFINAIFPCIQGNLALSTTMHNEVTGIFFRISIFRENKIGLMGQTTGAQESHFLIEGLGETSDGFAQQAATLEGWPRRTHGVNVHRHHWARIECSHKSGDHIREAVINHHCIRCSNIKIFSHQILNTCLRYLQRDIQFSRRATAVIDSFGNLTNNKGRHQL